MSKVVFVTSKVKFFRTDRNANSLCLSDHLGHYTYSVWWSNIMHSLGVHCAHQPAKKTSNVPEVVYFINKTV